MGNFAKELNEADFEAEVLKSDVPVLVDFWAPWCGPCVQLGPTIEELAKDHEGKLKVVKMNVDDNRTVASKYNIRSIPNLILFKNGEVLNQKAGAWPKQVLADFVKTAL